MNFLPLLPPSKILPTTFLLLSHFLIYGLAGRQSHIIGSKGFRSDCAFHLDNYSFNLCALPGAATTAKYSSDLIKSREIDSVEETRARLYEVALGGMPIEGSRRVPTSCDSDTWVCMTDRVSFDAQGSEGFLSKKQGIPVARRNDSNSQHCKIIVIKDEKSPTLQLCLDGGEAEGRPQSAEIEMLCDFNVESYLEFIDERNGIHSFRWTTLHGCPTNIKRSYIQSLGLSTTDGADDESQSEKEIDDDKLFPQSGTSRRWMMAVILVILMIAVPCSCLLLTYPHARHVESIRPFFYSLMPILSTAVMVLRPLGRSILAFIPRSLLCGVGNLKPFSQGSNEYVRRTEEDKMLPDADGYVEESWSGIESAECIPLTSDPKHGRNTDVKSYGATMPDVESLEQSGSIGRLFRE